MRCWSKVHRLVKDRNEVQSQTKGVKVKIEPVHSSLALGDGELDIPASPYSQSEDEEEIVGDNNHQSHSISLGNYKRAAASSSRCIFKNCGNSGLVIPSRAIVERLIIDYSYYIPLRSRICKRHQINTHKEWRKLVNDSRITDFTEKHLENLLSILRYTGCNNYCKKFDFKMKQDEQLCNYVLGVDYITYEEMLKDVTISKRMWSVKKALAMYLMKNHTGFSDNKISKFFGVSKKYTKNVIIKVHNILARLGADSVIHLLIK